MATITDTNTLDALYKEEYADSIENLIPEAAHLVRDVPFQNKFKLGKHFHQPVEVTQEQGFSYLATNGDINALPPVPMVLQDAQVSANIIAGRFSMTYEAVFRSDAAPKAAFRDSVGLQMENAMLSARKRQEVNFLYGATPLAVLASNTANVGNIITTTVVTSEWAPGIWVGGQNTPVDMYDKNGNKLNTGGPLTVKTSNGSALTVTFTANTLADAAAVGTEIHANASSVQVFYQGSKGIESPGLKAQLINTGVLFNIDASQYDLWMGTTYNNGAAPLHLANLQAAIAVAAGRGLDEDVTVFVNPVTWSDLNSDEAANRRYTADPNGGFVNGADKLTYYSQNGKMSIVPHIYVKQGDTFVLPMKRLKRIGSTPLTYKIPGTSDGKVFIQMPGAFGFEFRMYGQDCIFLEAPAKAIYINGIVN